MNGFAKTGSSTKQAGFTGWHADEVGPISESAESGCSDHFTSVRSVNKVVAGSGCDECPVITHSSSSCFAKLEAGEVVKPAPPQTMVVGSGLARRPTTGSCSNRGGTGSVISSRPGATYFPSSFGEQHEDTEVVKPTIIQTTEKSTYSGGSSTFCDMQIDSLRPIEGKLLFANGLLRATRGLGTP